MVSYNKYEDVKTNFSLLLNKHNILSYQPLNFKVIYKFWLTNLASLQDWLSWLKKACF